LFASVFAEYLVSAENHGKVTNLPLLCLYIAVFSVGTAALIVALNGLRMFPAHLNLRREGRVGFWAAIGGATLLLLFALQALVTTAATGDEPGGFVLFGLGFLLVVGGQMLAGFSILRAGAARATGWLLLLASAAAVIAVAVPADPFHDLGLFLFDAAWIGVGLVLIRPARWSSGRRQMLRWSAGIGLLVALTAPAAFAAAGGETVHFAGSFTQAAPNPCTGSSGTYSVTFNGVSHTSVSADGTVHHTATVTGETVFTPDDAGQPTYTGRFTAWDGQNGSQDTTITSTAAFHDMLTGSDGSRIRDQGVFHVTVLTDGTVAVAFDRFTLTCS
jgi:type 1 fimbria pilin